MTLCMGISLDILMSAIRKITGERGEPCGTPALICVDPLISPSQVMVACLRVYNRKADTSPINNKQHLGTRTRQDILQTPERAHQHIAWEADNRETG